MSYEQSIDYLLLKIYKFKRFSKQFFNIKMLKNYFKNNKFKIVL